MHPSIVWSLSALTLLSTPPAEMPGVRSNFKEVENNENFIGFA